MSGYVLDDLALVAGLAGTAGEHPRRELSRLINDAVKGGPALDVPALCLTEATIARRSIAEHVADLVASTPAGAMAVRELVRSDDLDALCADGRTLDWAGTHAALHALATDQPIVALHPDRYEGFSIDVVPM